MAIFSEMKILDEQYPILGCLPRERAYVIKATATGMSSVNGMSA